MNISKAALPPIQPPMPKDRDHPLFAAYQQHRNFCANNLITASSWEGFVYQRQQQMEHEDAVCHPRFKEFQNWCREVKSGRRTCPAGLFPHNFYFWLEGGRW